jgi:hypothetical protein
MSHTDPSFIPMLDWYGVWPSHRKEEDDGGVWSQDPPRGVALLLEPARKTDVFFADDHHLGALFVDPAAPLEERYKAIAPRGRYYRYRAKVFAVAY